MAAERFAVTNTTVPFGEAEVYFGDATAVGATGLGANKVGLIEGDVVAQITRMYQSLAYQEHTGDAPLRQKVQTGGIVVTLPVLVTDEAMIARLSPTGTLRLGDDTFQDVVTRTLLVIARDEVPAVGGLSYDGAAWNPAAPKNALWVWKAAPNLDRLIWGHTDMGKRFVEVPFTAHVDPTKPAGEKLATFGNPVAKGIGTVRL